MTEPNREALSAELEMIYDTGKIDSVALPNLILVLADHLDIDALDTIDAIRNLPNHDPETLLALPAPTRLIFDILETSQSNWARSLADLRRVIEIDSLLDDPEFR